MTGTTENRCEEKEIGSVAITSVTRSAPRLEPFVGPAPSGRGWLCDHPIAASVRLGDGQLHCLLAYRVLDRAESQSDSMPTPWTGSYLEEVLCDAPSRPPWRF